jgi:hypothetical protein
VKSIALWRAGIASVAAAAIGCVQPPPQADGGGVSDAAPGEPMTVDGAQCNAVVQNQALEGFTHIPCTSATTYMTVPPSSGNHYPTWPNSGTYDAPIAWGHLVHFMEHGGVVVVHNCGTAGCPDDIARAQALVAGVVDTACTPARVIMMPDPTLDVRFAAASWTWTLRADCFDETAFQQFVVEHLGRGLETVCGGYAIPDLCP